NFTRRRSIEDLMLEWVSPLVDERHRFAFLGGRALRQQHVIMGISARRDAHEREDKNRDPYIAEESSHGGLIVRSRTSQYQARAVPAMIGFSRRAKRRFRMFRETRAGAPLTVPSTSPAATGSRLETPDARRRHWRGCP